MDSEIHGAHPDILMITKSQVEMAEGFPVTTPPECKNSHRLHIHTIRIVMSSGRSLHVCYVRSLLVMYGRLLYD
ncbi:hypothetical protein LR48_Vigan01g043800 [Vigna angularis]|uniref:Uncharacterized protein n=1 Tax=Phaseolus angularis TaxID=3914 RepID=A0A0L9TJT7_PHAAN|nr:hypothetical protein LR48_Vigan01g043800 [Vigna angularis]